MISKYIYKYLFLSNYKIDSLSTIQPEFETLSRGRRIYAFIKLINQFLSANNSVSLILLYTSIRPFLV